MAGGVLVTYSCDKTALYLGRSATVPEVRRSRISGRFDDEWNGKYAFRSLRQLFTSYAQNYGAWLIRPRFWARICAVSNWCRPQGRVLRAWLSCIDRMN